ncbi:MAG: DoxX family protein [Flavobacterium sp.]|nr:DoxX family protein [Flavobacterium sp.]
MKIILIVFRVLLGLLLLFASMSYFFNLIPEPIQTGNIKVFDDGLKASVYMMPLVKSIELIVGLAYVSGKLMKIANLLLLPISINILMVNIFMMPEGIPIALLLFLGNIFFIYKDWNSYKGIFTA